MLKKIVQLELFMAVVSTLVLFWNVAFPKDVTWINGASLVSLSFFTMFAWILFFVLLVLNDDAI